MPHGVPVVEIKLTRPAKAWWKSRTLWVNAVVLLLAAAETQLNVLQPLLPVNVYALVAFGLPVMNAVLRLVTAQALAFKAAQATPQPAPPEQAP